MMDKRKTESAGFAAILNVNGYMVSGQPKGNDERGVMFIATKELEDGDKTAEQHYFDYINKRCDKVDPFEYRNSLSKMFDIISEVNHNRKE